MASLTLGLDVGCASVGWALIDEEGNSIVALGVRVFPEGVDRDQQGGEKSKSRGCRDARGMRCQLGRRARWPTNPLLLPVFHDFLTPALAVVP
jgi:CRISPR/Cas system Type II protein with McrA/HNH and RuvC-like nuclease domain